MRIGYYLLFYAFSCGGGKGNLERETDVDRDGYAAEEDCDDANPNVYPGADEYCDDIDNDCDTFIDEPGAIGSVQWFPDADGDTYGAVGEGRWSCVQPDGYTSNQTDCDDENANVNPGADEFCDDIDNDCDGVTDEDSAGDAELFYYDADGDGYGNAFVSAYQCSEGEGYVANDQDCNDSDDDIHPNATEICDQKDNDCDEAIDDLDMDVIDQLTWYLDLDGDGFGSGGEILACEVPLPGMVTDNTDCDDANVSISPAAPELCGNGTDDDCDGDIDSLDLDAIDVPWYTDSDGDGYGDPTSFVIETCEPPSGTASLLSDCDDSDSGISPAAQEIWYDGVDQDCANDGDFDADGDGFDSDLHGGEDCLDSDPDINPNEAEVCGNGIDDDCDGQIDPCDITTTIVGVEQGTRFGENIYEISDSNGNSVAEIFVAAPSDDTIDLGAGAVYLLDVDTEDNSTPIASFFGAGLADHFGHDFQVADINMDGLVDLVVGAYGVDTSATGAGGVYLFYGGFTGEFLVPLADATLLGVGSGDAAGWSLAVADDSTNDGSLDIVIGAPFSSLSEPQSGSVFLVRQPGVGVQSLNAVGAQLTGETSGENAGHAVETADFNQDGIQDYAVGAPIRSENNYEGAVYIVYGPVSGVMSLGDSAARWWGDFANARAGSALSSGGDMNGDGYPDLAIGSPNRDAGAGAVHVVYGPAQSTSSLAQADLRLAAAQSGANLGASLSMGDIDNDGQADLVVGAPFQDTNEPVVGAVYSVHGGTSGVLTAADYLYFGDVAEAELGVDVHIGASGIWASAPSSDVNAGAVYLFDSTWLSF
ncbi:MAG: MopE-related protein [Myxococcota bacterium]|nr:MopE-related protein [Myxococcota bacterium]